MPLAASWLLNDSLVSIERESGNGPAISLEHGSYPYVAAWKPGVGSAKALVHIAGNYLQRTRQQFGFHGNLEIDPQSGLIANQLPSRLHLTWLPIEDRPFPIPHAHAPRDPRHSFWIRRKIEPNRFDLSLILLAVPTLFLNDTDSAIGSRLGVRISARVLPQQNADWLVGITSSSCSAGLVEAMGPEGPVISPNLANYLLADFKNALKTRLRAMVGLPAASPMFIEGFRLLQGSGSEASLEVYAHIPRSEGLRGAAQTVTARVAVSEPGKVMVESLERSPLIAHQVTGLFEQDPASRAGNQTMRQARANRSPRELDQFTPPPNFPVLSGLVEVRQSELLGGDPTLPEPIPAVPRDPRTNAFAAWSALKHAEDLFSRMQGYGLVPATFFSHARLPLIVRYRTTISPGPGKDGRTVNAAVDYDPPRVDFGQGWQGGPDLREPLQVRYALGDLKRSASGREPLGMAADPRWSWHEFGHVLLAASTGGLELPFAHSVGDALAAIACDPDSRLSAAHQDGRLRGVTFPWVHVCRRHDREVSLGWSWSGTFHRPLRIPQFTNNRLRKGYHSEQVLSSSLFRLYRSLGGDSVDPVTGAPDPAARLRAANYVIYLIMRAIQGLPAAVNGSAQTPTQFVNALIAADVATLPAAAGPLAGRVGGWARKVIRWAFEAQGLYSNAADDVVNNAPGEPPDPDVFIDTNRPRCEGNYPDGGYMPVSLHWNAAPGKEPWLATNQAMQFSNDHRRLHVTVGNRNLVQANNVQVRAWYASWLPGQPNPPAWDPAAWVGNTPIWREMQQSPSPMRNIPGSGFVQFPPMRWNPNPGRYAVLAAVLCAGDQPNIYPDPALALPTAANPTPLVDLICGDNNLGLAIHRV